MPEKKKITPGLIIAGRYRVIREIGRGAVGSVHLVQHVHTDEQFALKVLHDPAAASPEKIARFRVEARAPARIDSDHVVRITDADIAPELGGAPFFVMEYLRGRDLAAELDARGALPAPEVVLYMRQAARALDKAHALGIVHRDLKPENLILTEREDGVPVLKLVDFGIAKLTGDAATIAQMVTRTQTGRIFGTPLFMSPEQATGRASLVGHATDVWALGLVTNRLLTGRDHFESETVAELIGKIAYDTIRPPSEYGCDLGAAYDAWFLRCCHREIGKRFRSAGEAVTALAAALGIEEGDALVDAVISSRRALGDLAHRDTVRAPPGAEVPEGEILVSASDFDVKVPTAPRVPAVGLQAADVFGTPAPSPAQSVELQASRESRTPGSGGGMARTALDAAPLALAEERRNRLILVFSVVFTALLGLGIGLAIFGYMSDAPPAAASSGVASASSAPVGSVSAPSTAVAPPPVSSPPATAVSAPPLPATAPTSLPPRGGWKRKDPLSGRH